MGNTLKPHLENAEKTGAFQYCGKNINEFPADLQKLSKFLRTLDLSKNKIQNLPPNISVFTNLKHLSLNGNRLVRLPNEMGELKKMESLSLNNNFISEIPETFGSLKNLRNLSLSNNKLVNFPNVLSKLQQLDVIDMSNNKIAVLGHEICGLQVSELNLNRNQINSLSEEGLVSCDRLKTLRLEENNLTIDCISTEILKNSTISLLVVDGNLFEDKELRNLEGYTNYMQRYTAAKKKLF